MPIPPSSGSKTADADPLDGGGLDKKLDKKEDPLQAPITLTVGDVLSLQRLLAQRDKQIADLKNERRATTELLLKPDWDPVQKIVLMVILNDLGTAPGRPVAARVADYTPTTLGLLAKKSKVCDRQFRKHYDSFCGVYFHERRTLVDVVPHPTPPEPGPDTSTPEGAVKQGTEESSRAKKEPPTKRTQVSLAPKGGSTWDALNHPATLPRPETRKLDEDAEKAKKKRAQEKEKLAAAERILAQCAHCGCSTLAQLDLKITCKNCGSITTMEQAKRPKKRGRAPVRPWTRRDGPRATDDDDGPDDPEPTPTPKGPTMGAEDSSAPTKPEPVQLSLDDAVSTAGQASSPPVDIDRALSLASSQHSVPLGVEESSAKVVRNNDSTLAEDSSCAAPDMGPEESSYGLPQQSPADAEAERLAILDEIVDEFYPVVSSFTDHIVMKRRSITGNGAKYVTPKDDEGNDLPLTKERLREHFLGTLTVGTRTALGDIRAPSGASLRAMAWDADENRPDDWLRVQDAARLLLHYGLHPILSKNPLKENSGHLWLFYSAPIDALQALLACHTLAPMLAEVAEHYPNSTSTGGRIRLPGGAFPAPDNSDPPFLVGFAPDVGDIEWYEGTSWEGWSAATQISDPAILQAVYIPADLRPKPEPAKPIHRAPGLSPLPKGAGFDFAKWSRENPASRMVDIDKAGYFCAPWRRETKASVKLYPDGHWHDYGPDGRHGVDSFDLYCAIGGFWDDVNNVPDKGAGARSLGWKPGEGTAAVDEAPSVPMFDE